MNPSLQPPKIPEQYRLHQTVIRLQHLFQQAVEDDAPFNALRASLQALDDSSASIFLEPNVIESEFEGVLCQELTIKEAALQAALRITGLLSQHL
jgi:hypothetical protein